MTTDFSSYLDVPVEDIEAPLPIPVGHYYATIKSWKPREIDFKQGDGPQPHVTLTFTLNSPSDDVDETLLPKDGIAGKISTRDYQLNNESGPHQLRILGETTCGLPVKGLHLGDLLPMLLGQEVMVHIAQRAGKGDKAETMYAYIDKVLSVG